MNNQFNKFSESVTNILAYSREEAARLGSRAISSEHIVLAMLRMANATTNTAFLNLDVHKIKAQLENRVRNDDMGIWSDMEPNLSENTNNILKLAVLEARLMRMQTIDEMHLLLAILHDSSNNGAKQVLEENSLDYDTLKNLCSAQKDEAQSVSSELELPYDDEDEDDNLFKSENHSGQHSATSQRTATKSKTPITDNFGTDLTQAAVEGKLDPCVGREREITRVIEILGRRKKNNPILIGEPGVGKSAIVEGLAQMIANKQTSPLLFGKRIIALDLTAIVAGTKYRGQFEERMRALVKELEQNQDIIVFIDEIHTMVGAGSTPGSMDAANILKPALARGNIQCIGATTLDEFRKSIEKDGALERRFQKVIIEQTSPEETLQILKNLRGRYEEHHHVSYTEEALAACVKLTERYISDRAFPDKAIDAMDEVGAKTRLRSCSIPNEIVELQNRLEIAKQKKQSAVMNQNFELAAAYRDEQTKIEEEIKHSKDEWMSGNNCKKESITANEVAEVVSTMTGIPVQRIAQEEGVRLKGMANQLKQVVVAQDAAIEKMVKAIQRNRVGLKDANHPIGTFMFLGPTGVGKTYLAKKLAEFMFGSQDALIRIDMSEYSESFNVSRLVGAPPGYVGYDEGGQLTERVRRHPYSIVLLDELEKAHGNVFNMLLQVLDEGRLTDGNGRLVDFRNTVIIMTSNAGTRQLKEFGRGIGFNSSGTGLMLNEQDKENARRIVQKALSKQFSPEFLNRLDEIITFDQLDVNAIKEIVDIELNSLYKRIESVGYNLSVDEDAKMFVAEKGYDVQFGARPLKRAIQNYIEDEVSELIINGELKQGSTIYISRDGERLKTTAED